jgi:hypothetical protein
LLFGIGVAPVIQVSEVIGTNISDLNKETRLLPTKCNGRAVDEVFRQSSTILLGGFSVSVRFEALSREPRKNSIVAQGLPCDNSSCRYPDAFNRRILGMLALVLSRITIMKRFIASALIIGVSTIGLVGCEQKSEVTDQKVIKTPGGTDTVTTKIEEKKTGDAKDPAPAPATDLPK